MPLEEKITTSLTILITGFVVVFAVLLLLILLISLYGKIVSSALQKSKPKEPAILSSVMMFGNRVISY